MLARNSLLRRSARSISRLRNSNSRLVSASFFAYCSCAVRNRSSASFRSVVSRTIAVAWKPSSEDPGLKLISTGKRDPSLRRPWSAKPVPIVRVDGWVRYWARRPTCTLRNSSGIRSSTGCPNNSSREYPNISSVTRFIKMIRPSSSTCKMASGAASSSLRKRSSGNRFGSLIRFAAPRDTPPRRLSNRRSEFPAIDY